MLAFLLLLFELAYTVQQGVVRRDYIDTSQEACNYTVSQTGPAITLTHITRF